MVDKYESVNLFLFSYKNGEQIFDVEKSYLRSTIGFDTENSVKEELQINGADATYYRTADNWGTVIFNNGEYIYHISGNISKEELVKIAQNAEWWIRQNAKFPFFLNFLSQNDLFLGLCIMKA